MNLLSVRGILVIPNKTGFFFFILLENNGDKHGTGNNTWLIKDVSREVSCLATEHTHKELPERKLKNRTKIKINYF